MKGLGEKTGRGTNEEEKEKDSFYMHLMTNVQMKMPTRYLGLWEQMPREAGIREVVWEGISSCWQGGAENHENWVSCSALLREQKKQML